MFTKVTILALASTLLHVANAAVCSTAQLSGTFGTFRLPGGGGVYDAGTNQIVSWSWPTGSKITAIKAVNICQGSSCFPPISVSGLPISFTSSQPDRGGGIPVQLPFSLTSGTDVFRVTLTSGGVDCTIDSAPFTAVGGAVNGNQCALGDSLCFSGNLIAPCIQQGAGTQPNIWGFGKASQCPGSCVQNGNKASCVLSNPNPGTCTTATNGFMKCTSSSTFDVCNNGAFVHQSCPAGTVCKTYQTNYIICDHA